MVLEWNDEYLVGNEVIDAQHKEIFARFNNFNAACNQLKGREELCSLYGFLKNYIDEHFEAEEALQVNEGYPKNESHKQQHELFKKEFAKLSDSLEHIGPSAILVVKTNMALTKWLIRHIQVLDADFVQFVKGNNGQ